MTKERAERMDKKMNCMYVNLAGEVEGGVVSE